jgi:hypothetical protein
LAVAVGVVAAIADKGRWPSPRAADAARDRRYRLHERE